MKNKTSNLVKYDNYRSMTLVIMFAKVFELCLSIRLTQILHTDELQFGFVPGKLRLSKSFIHIRVSSKLFYGTR